MRTGPLPLTPSCSQPSLHTSSTRDRRVRCRMDVPLLLRPPCAAIASTASTGAAPGTRGCGERRRLTSASRSGTSPRQTSCQTCSARCRVAESRNTALHVVRGVFQARRSTQRREEGEQTTNSLHAAAAQQILRCGVGTSRPVADYCSCSVAQRQVRRRPAAAGGGGGRGRGPRGHLWRPLRRPAGRH